MQQLKKLHVSTPWGHLQAYKIWYHTRYISCYVRDPVVYIMLVFFGPMPPHVLVDFVVLPPGHGRSVTDV